LKSAATLLLVEPADHVDKAEFAEELASAAQAGLVAVSQPPIRGGRTALLRKS
jgi:hypothetical protein